MDNENKAELTEEEILWVKGVRNNVRAVPFWTKTFGTIAGAIATFQFLIKPWMNS